MIKNVIFDLGRVIYTFWPREYLVRLGYDEATTDALMRLIFDSPLWIEMDRGACTFEESIAHFCQNEPSLAEEVKRVFQADWVNDVIRIMPESLAFFYEVKKQGYRIYILSNFCAESFAQVYARDAFLKEADGMVISAHVRLVKPDPAIYKHLLNQYDLIPEECVFIDDNTDNIKAAKSLGIHGICFTHITDCKQQFEKITRA